MKDVTVYDNNGDTYDRYTVIIGESCYGMSHNPMSPMGFNQYCGEVGSDVILDDHLGEMLACVPDDI